MTVQVDVRDLVGRPGSQRTIHILESIGGLQTELARVSQGRPVEADLRMESLVEGVLASGSVAGRMTYVCARCLKPFEAEFRVDLQELFTEGEPLEEGQYTIDEGFMDLEPLIRDAVVTSMPFAPLCRPGCLGLCSRCGADLNLGDCACPPEEDRRWSALSQIRFDDGPSEGDTEKRNREE